MHYEYPYRMEARDLPFVPCNCSKNSGMADTRSNKTMMGTVGIIYGYVFIETP